MGIISGDNWAVYSRSLKKLKRYHGDLTVTLMVRIGVSLQNSPKMKHHEAGFGGFKSCMFIFQIPPPLSTMIPFVYQAFLQPPLALPVNFELMRYRLREGCSLLQNAWDSATDSSSCEWYSGYNSRTILDTGWFGCWSVVSIGFLPFPFYIMFLPQKMHWESPVDFHSRGIDGSATKQVKFLSSYQSWSFTWGRRFEPSTCGWGLSLFCWVTAAHSPEKRDTRSADGMLLSCFDIFWLFPLVSQDRCVTRWMGLDCQAYTLLLFKSQVSMASIRSLMLKSPSCTTQIPRFHDPWHPMAHVQDPCWAPRDLTLWSARSCLGGGHCELRRHLPRAELCLGNGATREKSIPKLTWNGWCKSAIKKWAVYVF